MLYFTHLAIYEKLLFKAGVALAGESEAARNWIYTFSNLLTKELRSQVTVNAIALHPVARNWR